MSTPSTLQRGDGGTGDRRTVPLTQLVHLMAEYQKLGEHRQTFTPASMSGDTFVRGCGLIAGGLAIVACLCATAGWWVGSATVAVFALLAVLAAGLRSRLAGAGRGARLDLFDYGLTVFRSGQEIVAFRWDTLEVRQQVIPFHNSATPATDYSFALSGPGGVREAFDGHQFADANEWGPLIQSAVTATQLPGVVSSIDAEETVRFGEVAVNLNELAFGGSVYPWEEVQKIDAQAGLVRIKFAGRWISLAAVESIPNFYIFNEVIERLRIAAAEELAEGIAPQPLRDDSDAESNAEPDRVVSEFDSVDSDSVEPLPESAASEAGQHVSESAAASAGHASNSVELETAGSESTSAASESAEPAPELERVEPESDLVAGESVGAEPDPAASGAVGSEPKSVEVEPKQNDSAEPRSDEQSAEDETRRAMPVGSQVIAPEADEPEGAEPQAPGDELRPGSTTLAGRGR